MRHLVFPTNFNTTHTSLKQPQPGMESRPDRMLISRDLKAVSARQVGDGAVYKSKFFYHIIWNRLMLYLTAINDASQGKHGRSCE